MSDVEEQLQSLALAAVQHASDHHGRSISPSLEKAINDVDTIIDRERSAGDEEFVEPLKLCYGAWFGTWLREQFGANWVGLSEPNPPRIQLAGAFYSPIDAVQRRLLGSSAKTLRQLTKSFHSHNRATSEAVSVANRVAWDGKANDTRFVLAGGLPADRSEALAAIDPWLLAEGSLDGRKILCLAAGGGTHGPLHALAGGRVTVVDLSPKQIECDQRIADEHGLSIETIVTSMDELSMLSDRSMDAVIHPVSLCYVRDVRPVYNEIARVLKPGGLYISQQKQPASLQASASLTGARYVIESPADDGFELSEVTEATMLRESGTIEFVHPLGTLLGALCRSGFKIESIVEPPRGDAWAPEGSAEHRACYLPPYLKIKARRV